MLVKNASIFHNRLNDMLEEVPHTLTDLLLIVHDFTETSESLISALSGIIVESSENWLL